MRRILTAIAVTSAVVLVAVATPCDVTSYFTSAPGSGAIERTIIATIQYATQDVRVAMYSLTDSDLVQALISARARGITVEVLLDGLQAASSSAQVQSLVSADISVKAETTSGLLHHKFVVIDRYTVITGSYNWSNAAATENFENVVVMRCAEIAQQYYAAFASMSSLLSFVAVPRAQQQQQQTCAYIGNKSSKVFHLPSCGSVTQMSESNKVCFTSRQQAVDAGYTACGNCHP